MRIFGSLSRIAIALLLIVILTGCSHDDNSSVTKYSNSTTKDSLTTKNSNVCTGNNTMAIEVPLPPSKINSK